MKLKLTEKQYQFLTELNQLLRKYNAELSYSTDDIGIFVEIDGEEIEGLHFFAHKMKDLIQALTIFLKYGNPKHPTHCEHDKLQICGIDPDDVSEEDKRILLQLGFIEQNKEGKRVFISYKFGSA